MVIWWPLLDLILTRLSRPSRSPSSMTRLCPPRRATTFTLSSLESLFSTVFLICLSSSPPWNTGRPGVEIPNTALGLSRWLLLVMGPRSVSLMTPCCSITPARYECTGFGWLKNWGLLSISSFSLLISVTGNCLAFLKYSFCSAFCVSNFLLAPMAGIIWVMPGSGTQPM